MYISKFKCLHCAYANRIRWILRTYTSREETGKEDTMLARVVSTTVLVCVVLSCCITGHLGERTRTDDKSYYSLVRAKCTRLCESITTLCERAGEGDRFVQLFKCIQTALNCQKTCSTYTWIIKERLCEASKGTVS